MTPPVGVACYHTSDLITRVYEKPFMISERKMP